MKPSFCEHPWLRAVDRSRRALPLSLLCAAMIAACGSNPQPADSPKPPVSAPAAGPAQPDSNAAPAPDPEVVAQCLAAAGAKRAKFSGEPAKVGVKHVLVKYKGAKSADDKIARSREEACVRAMEARDKVRGGADWDEVVKQYSEEPGAATRGGTVGTVERSELAKPFADAAFELSVNQLSDVVETEFGFHIILRTE